MMFEQATRQHRRELHVHCYRMLASYEEAEDAVQEVFLRAWRARDTFDGTNVRAWLYRIATNTCVDLIRAKARAPKTRTEISWLTHRNDWTAREPGPRERELLSRFFDLFGLPPTQVPAASPARS